MPVSFFFILVELRGCALDWGAGQQCLGVIDTLSEGVLILKACVLINTLIPSGNCSLL